MLVELTNQLRSALEDQERSRQLLTDLEERCAQAPRSSDIAHLPGVCTSLFVIARICGSIEGRLDQTRGSIEYHRLATEMPKPHLLDAIDATITDSETRRLVALDELIGASIEFAPT